MTSPAQASALAWFRSVLTQWGIPQLLRDADRLVRQGLGADAIRLQLEETRAYKQRFAANEVRRQHGLAVLSPAEYIANEAAYAQVRRQYGLPAGFYDSKDATDKLIASDVAPQEFAERARDAQERYLLGPAENRAWWRQNIGGTDAEAIAGILDPKTALPLINRRLAAAEIGGAALGEGLAVTKSRAEYLAAAGVTADQARKGYGEIALGLPTEQAIAQRFGTTLTQGELEAATFGVAGSADAEEKRRRLAASEQGLFSGRAGADSSSLSRPAAGQY